MWVAVRGSDFHLISSINNDTFSDNLSPTILTPTLSNIAVISTMSSPVIFWRAGLAAIAGLGGKAAYDSMHQITRTGSEHGGADETNGIPGTLGRRLTNRSNSRSMSSSSHNHDAFQEEIKQIIRRNTLRESARNPWSWVCGQPRHLFLNRGSLVEITIVGVYITISSISITTFTYLWYHNRLRAISYAHSLAETRPMTEFNPPKYHGAHSTFSTTLHVTHP